MTIINIFYNKKIIHLRIQIPFCRFIHCLQHSCVRLLLIWVFQLKNCYLNYAIKKFLLFFCLPIALLKTSLQLVPNFPQNYINNTIINITKNKQDICHVYTCTFQPISEKRKRFWIHRKLFFIVCSAIILYHIDRFRWFLLLEGCTLGLVPYEFGQVLMMESMRKLSNS